MLTQLQTDYKQNNKALSLTFLVFSHTTLDFSFPLSSVYLGGKALEIFREKKKKEFFYRSTHLDWYPTPKSQTNLQTGSVSSQFTP